MSEDSNEGCDLMGMLDDCTAAQVEAITHVNGPLLVVAGAGSDPCRQS